jgi:hypothetical protein
MVENDEASSKVEPSGSHEGEPAQKSSIKAELEKFVKTADSLVSTAPLSLWTLEAAHRGAYQDYTNFWQAKCVNIRKEGNETVADVPPGLVHEFTVIQRRLDRSSIATKVIGNSSVVSLVSQYDSFLGGLLRAFFHIRPELLDASEKTLTLKELRTFESIDAAREYIVEKEVEAVIRKSHVEHFEWLENRFEIQLRKGLSIWPTFVEVTERRNLLVHCGGIVSSHYLSVCKQHGVDCGAATVGTELMITRAYLVQAYECLVEVGVKLAHVLWRKLVPGEREDADINLISFCLDLMNESRHGLAKRLLDFATCVLKKWHSEVTRLLFVVNRAQAYKWLNEEGTCQKILANEDWSAVDDRLSLGVAVLREDVNNAVSLMKKLRDSPLVPKDCYRLWPIFKRFRKTPEFMKAYKEIFGEDFVDIPEQNTITFRLEWGDQKKKKAPDVTGTQKPN